MKPDAYIAAVTNYDQTRANSVYPEAVTTNVMNNYVNLGVVRRLNYVHHQKYLYSFYNPYILEI